jgi:hypothetical protein
MKENAKSPLGSSRAIIRAIQVFYTPMKPSVAVSSPEPQIVSTLRRDVTDEAARLGSTLIGFAPVDR